jgi:two-component system cell cycle sensor histidine kinase/response regulator CckA
VNLQSLTNKLLSHKKWPFYLVCIITLLSQFFTAAMNIINSLIWWGRIDLELILIGCIDSFAVTLLIAPVAIYLVRHSFNLEEMNRNLQKEITERTMTEEALRESEEKFSKAFRASPNLLAITRLSDGFVVDVNDSFARTLCYDRQELIGKTTLALNLWINPGDRDKILQTINQQKSIQNTEVQICTRSGEPRWVLFSGEAISLNDEPHLITVATDITERKRAEHEKERLEDQLRQAQKMEAIATLAGGIAHRFNNALLVITASLDLLEMELANREMKMKYIQPMKVSSAVMSELTKQLLAYARGGKYQAKVIFLSDFVRETLPLIEHTIKPSVYVETDLPHDLRPVKADVTQMQMVLSAIVTNASEAIEDQGRIRITCRNAEITAEEEKDFPGLEPGSYVSLVINDDGKGMDEIAKSRVFEPFFTTKFQGRGLGLPAAYGVVKNHDGWIGVDSELGKGTTVRIYLPTLEVEVKKPEAPKIEICKGKETVLLIEDEEMVMDVSHALLETLGYRVLKARTGEEAIRLAETFDGDIDVAILDIVLPDMEGKTVHSFLMKARPKLKVIVCSGYSLEGPAQEILHGGAHAFIQKPFSLGEISTTLREVLGGK